MFIQKVQQLVLNLIGLFWLKLQFILHFFNINLCYYLFLSPNTICHLNRFDIECNEERLRYRIFSDNQRDEGDSTRVVTDNIQFTIGAKCLC
jgi:hypothetical protein